MPESVVDGLESVEIENTDDEETLVTLGISSGVLQPVVEKATVGKSCQGIVEGEKLGTFLLAALGLSRSRLSRTKERLRKTPSRRFESSSPKNPVCLETTARVPWNFWFRKMG